MDRDTCMSSIKYIIVLINNSEEFAQQIDDTLCSHFILKKGWKVRKQ